MNIQDFVAKYSGKKIDWDGAYQGQCVDLFRQYVHEVLALSQPKSVVGAADFWTNYDSDPVLKENFDKIANSETFVPQAGDVGIWNKKAGGGFGHIGVCTGKGDINTFESFDQNWKTISVCELIAHNYTNFYGVLRSKRQPTDVSKELSECNLHKSNLQNQVNGLLKDIEAQKGVISDTETKLGTANGRIQELTKQNDNLSTELGIKTSALLVAEQSAKTAKEALQKELSDQLDFGDKLEDEQDAHSITKKTLDNLLWDIEDTLKLSHPSDDMASRISIVQGALQSQIQTNVSYEKQVIDLENEVKKLNTYSKHIAKLSIRDCIIILIDKIKEKYGKK